MRENLIESIWLAVTIVYGVVVIFALGQPWGDGFVIAGAVVVGLGWVAIGYRRRTLRKHYEERARSATTDG